MWQRPSRATHIHAADRVAAALHDPDELGESHEPSRNARRPCCGSTAATSLCAHRPLRTARCQLQPPTRRRVLLRTDDLGSTQAEVNMREHERFAVRRDELETRFGGTA